MDDSELEVLRRAEQLFATAARPAPSVPPRFEQPTDLLDRAVELSPGAARHQYRSAVRAQREVLHSAARTDAMALGIVRAAHDDHARAKHLTRNVVDQARADTAAPVDSALAHREAMRRKAARLRSQHAHVRSAWHRARQHGAAARALRYRGRRSRPTAKLALPPAGSRAGTAVRAALSRLGRPYVWGATGPSQFDCSGLTQWSYAQAGVHLDRTTYQQIHAGIPVPRAEVRPGDLVFPHTGHVQLAIGNNLVIEAPHAGAAVRISPLGSHIAIRRPTG